MKKRMTPDSYFVAFLVLSILFHMTIPLFKIIPFPLNLFGIILIIVGILMTLITNSALLKNRTSIQPFETPDVLITSGLFKLSRNPLYLGMAIAFFGLVITLGSLSPFIFPIIFVIIINRVIIPYEENKLEIVFGDKYLDYKTKTRRWF
ncbi:MAG: methyltransferase [Bacteroidales bacterium]|nr:methyltransferase [Bacteroidales bacterium]